MDAVTRHRKSETMRVQETSEQPFRKRFSFLHIKQTRNKSYISVWQLYEFARGGVRKCHSPGDLSQQNCTLSQFWRPEVCNRGFDGARLSLSLSETCEREFFLVSFSFWRRPSTFGVQRQHCRLCLHLLMSSSCKDTGHIGSGAQPSPVGPHLN